MTLEKLGLQEPSSVPFIKLDGNAISSELLQCKFSKFFLQLDKH